MNLKQNIGQQIKAMRLAAGLNQSGLANRLGVSKQYISGVEAGKETLSLEQVEKFAAALGATVDIVINPIDKLAEAAATLSARFRKVTPTAEELARRMKGMTSKKKVP